MNNRGVVVSGLVRALTSVCLLAGVLAMHALTMDHDPAMIAMSGTAASATPFQATSEMPEHVSGLTGSMRAGAAYVSSDSHQMGQLCVAVLAGSLLLLGLVLMLAWLRSARSAPWSLRLFAVRLSPLLGRSPPWLTPSLSKLCVMRT
jgi:crotonobetainyl-CoA:carnitine CoA-transferase CaiB-like acyl-CoA transferase